MPKYRVVIEILKSPSYVRIVDELGGRIYNLEDWWMNDGPHKDARCYLIKFRTPDPDISTKLHNLLVSGQIESYRVVLDW